MSAANDCLYELQSPGVKEQRDESPWHPEAGEGIRVSVKCRILWLRSGVDQFRYPFRTGMRMERAGIMRHLRSALAQEVPLGCRCSHRRWNR